MAKRMSSEWRVCELSLNPFKSDLNIIPHRTDLPTGVLRLLPLNSFKFDSNSSSQMEFLEQ